MSRTICIPCLNLKYWDNDYTIHRWSKAKCSACGIARQGLVVSLGDSKGRTRHKRRRPGLPGVIPSLREGGPFPDTW